MHKKSIPCSRGSENDGASCITLSLETRFPAEISSSSVKLPYLVVRRARPRRMAPPPLPPPALLDGSPSAPPMRRKSGEVASCAGR
eukprot:9495316-Pyramimonas_sp.AAC.2